MYLKKCVDNHVKEEELRCQHLTINTAPMCLKYTTAPRLLKNTVQSSGWVLFQYLILNHPGEETRQGSSFITSYFFILLSAAPSRGPCLHLTLSLHPALSHQASAWPPSAHPWTSSEVFFSCLQLHTQHPSSNIFTVLSLHMSEPSPPQLSNSDKTEVIT